MGFTLAQSQVWLRSGEALAGFRRFEGDGDIGGAQGPA